MKIKNHGVWRFVYTPYAAKYQLYERLGVKEYFLFDPLDEYLQPRLQGFTLVQERYQALPLSAEGDLVSRELGLILRPQKDLLRLILIPGRC
jgi:Uma2 family endonuclease